MRLLIPLPRLPDTFGPLLILKDVVSREEQLPYAPAGIRFCHRSSNLRDRHNTPRKVQEKGRKRLSVVGRAVIVGGCGPIGRAAARRLADDGFHVTVLARSGVLPVELQDRGVVLARGDRSGRALDTAIGAGADLLVDVIPYAAADAGQLVGLADRVGSVVATSSASVYADDAGRSMDASTGADDFPHLPVPVGEEQPTVPAGDDTYSARKVAIERTLLAACPVPVTIVRPCAVYGVGARSLREWFFIRRVLDGRPRVVLANAGRSVFHTTSAENIAELVRLAARSPGAGVVNCGDPDPPGVGRIAAAVAETMDHRWEEVHLAGPPVDGVGESPWEASHPVVLDMSYAEARLGYRPVVTYEQGLRPVCEWLLKELSHRPWQEVLPEMARFGDEMFNYASEDSLAARL